MALTLDDLCVSPDHYLHSFEREAAVFVPMDRAAYHRSIFLDHRISPAEDGTLHLPLSAIGGLPPLNRASWIFHVAHCGSTLLARALDRLDGNLVLREPLALRQAAIERDSDLLALVLPMVSKRYQAGLPTVIKANVPVNFILPEIVAADMSARAIFLYLGFDDYVRAILRSDNHREWLRRVTTLLASDLGLGASATDAERVAALWLGQMRAFSVALGTLPEGRSLDAELFFSEPARVLRAVARHLGVDLAEAEIDARVGGPLFSTYAKNPTLAFDNQARLARRLDLEASLAPEIADAQRWAAGAGGVETSFVTVKAAALAI